MIARYAPHGMRRLAPVALDDRHQVVGRDHAGPGIARQVHPRQVKGALDDRDRHLILDSVLESRREEVLDRGDQCRVRIEHTPVHQLHTGEASEANDVVRRAVVVGADPGLLIASVLTRGPREKTRWRARSGAPCRTSR